MDELAGMLKELVLAGCHNWNLVSPTPWLESIREALEQVRSEGLSLPVVYNTSGFERVETLAAHSDLVDVYLTDLRYARAGSAAEGSGYAGYVGLARKALMAMWEQKGPLELDDEGTAVSGTICRILILPAKAEEAVLNLKWLADTIGTDVPVSIMAQYLPVSEASGKEPWNRGITWEEYETVRTAAEDLGFASGWMQEFGQTACEELVGYKMAPDMPAGVAVK